MLDLTVERFDDLSAVIDDLAPFDACFYCAGAPPVGTAEALYRQVTRDLTLHVARAFAERNADGRFLYVSGAHADPDSRFMPLRVKGETERALRQLPLRTVMLRPGGIQPAHGERSPHAWMRPLYAVAAPLMGIGVRLAPGVMTSTAHLGRALLALAAMPAPPPVVENADINRLGAPG
ncbi:MAG: oxidoreductase [Gammaproteobacteria bacterium]|nr:MAG: oxidoreductase [Gammaproteobacteria bacterium]